MRFVVTGGEGFIGRNIVSLLRNRGHDVISLDINGKPDRLVSVLDYDALRKVFMGADGVFHLAAVTSPPQFEENPQLGFVNNVTGTLNVVLAGAKEKVRRIAFASSSATYGMTGSKTSEGMQVIAHNNLYPITKVVGEMLGKYASLRGETEFVSLRYFNAYGPGENTKSLYSSVIWKFVEASLSGKDLVIYGDGTQSRDFIYVTDVARATIEAFDRGRNGECYNIGSGVSNDFNTIARMVKDALGIPSRIVHVDNPLKNYQNYTLADISKIRSETGWKPVVGLEEGIRMTAEWQKAGSSHQP